MAFFFIAPTKFSHARMHLQYDYFFPSLFFNFHFFLPFAFLLILCKPTSILLTVLA